MDFQITSGGNNAFGTLAGLAFIAIVLGPLLLWWLRAPNDLGDVLHASEPHLASARSRAIKHHHWFLLVAALPLLIALSLVMGSFVHSWMTHRAARPGDNLKCRPEFR